MKLKDQIITYNGKKKRMGELTKSECLKIIIELSTQRNNYSLAVALSKLINMKIAGQRDYFKKRVRELKQ